MRVTKRGALPKCNPWALVVLVLFTAVAAGCQFLQNEFWTY